MDSQPFSGFGDTGTSFLQDLTNEESGNQPVYPSTQPQISHVPPQNTTMDYRGFPPGQANIPAPYGAQQHPLAGVDARSQQMPAYYSSSQQQQYYQQYPMNKLPPTGHHDPTTYNHPGAKSQQPWPHYANQQPMSVYGQQTQDPMWSSQSAYPSGSYHPQSHQMPPSRYSVPPQTPGMTNSSIPTHSTANKPICHTGVSFPMQMRMPVASMQSQQQAYMGSSQGYMQHPNYTMSQQGPASGQQGLVTPAMSYPPSQESHSVQQHKTTSLPHRATNSPGMTPRPYAPNQPVSGYSQQLQQDMDPAAKQIYNLEDRLRHLYQTRGQSPGIHQEMMDVQEQLRTLKATRETEHLMKQRNRLIDLPQTQSSPSAQTSSPQGNIPHIPPNVAPSTQASMHPFPQIRHSGPAEMNSVHSNQNVPFKGGSRAPYPQQPVVVDVPSSGNDNNPPSLTAEVKTYSKVNNVTAENITPPQLTVADEEGLTDTTVRDDLTTPPHSNSVDIKESSLKSTEAPVIISPKQSIEGNVSDKPLDHPPQPVGKDTSVAATDSNYLTPPISTQSSLVCSPTSEHLSPPKMATMTCSPVPSNVVSPSRSSEVSPHFGPRYPGPQHPYHPHSQPGYYGPPPPHPYSGSYGPGMPPHIRMPGHPSQTQLPGPPPGQPMYPGQGQLMMQSQPHIRHYQSIAPSPHGPYSGVNNMSRMPGYPPLLPKEQQPPQPNDYYLGPQVQPYPPQGPQHMQSSGAVITPPHGMSASPSKLPTGELPPDSIEPKPPKKKRQYKRRKPLDADNKETTGEEDKSSLTKDDLTASLPSLEGDPTVMPTEDAPPAKKKRAPPRKKQPSKKKVKLDSADGASIDATLNESLADTSAATIPAEEAAEGGEVPSTADDSTVVAAPPIAKKKKIIKPKKKELKKKKPLPTLIKKKRKSRRGFDSDSDHENCMTSSKKGGANSVVEKSTEDILKNTSKRRSERVTNRKKYSEVEMGLFSDDDLDMEKEEDDIATMQETRMEDETEVSTRVVDKILGHRTAKRTVQRTRESEDGKPVSEEEIEEAEEDVEEYYIKYKGYSYLHCEWKCLDEIEDLRILPKIKRYMSKCTKDRNEDDEEEDLFNPDYVEVDRVLDMKVFCNDVEVIQGKKKIDLSEDDEEEEIKVSEVVPEVKDSEKPTENMSTDTDEATKKEDLDDKEKSNETVREDTKIVVDTCANESLKTVKGEEAPLTIVEEDASTIIPVNEELTTKSPTTEDTIHKESSQPSTETASCVNDKLSDTAICDPVPVEIPPVQENLNETSTADSSDLKSTENVPIPSPTSNSNDKREDVNMHSAESTLEVEIIQDSPKPTEEAPKKDNDNQVEEEPEKKESDSNSVEDLVRRDRAPSPVEVTYYLVKWKTLPYEEATWELAQDVDPNKVKEYIRWREPPAVETRQIERPNKSEWQKIDDHRQYKNENRLRDYQLEGINWLTFCYFNHRNCILADEMGLGKTVQSITFLIEVFSYGVQGPFLIIVPLSTVGNWQREFENWSDLNVIVYHGSSTSRSMLQEYEMFYKDSKGQKLRDVYKFHALITTYEILMTDIEFIGQFDWRIAVIDEAHRLKNMKCKLGEGLRYLELEHRVLLTGTPLQNNVEELFCLLNFLEPKKFPSAETFLAEFGDLKTEEQVDNLKSILKPMMLRRLKEDVEKSLAPKEETIIEVELTNIQKKYYRAIMERNFAFLSKGATSNANIPNLMNTMMELRKCCNHPFLIKGAEDNILAEMRQQPVHKDSSVEQELLFHALVHASGKLVLVHKLLPKLKSGGHKVLIFSQMIRVLDILEDYLIHQRYSYERIDGRIHGMFRQEAIDRFCNDSSKFVFLLCTKAGGLGINLTAADVVIIYDSDWNPQNDLQAQARCHRIGQLKMVNIYRLITRNTYERDMFDRASLKLGLDKAVLQSMGSREARQAQLSKKEVEDLLKKGAYAAVMDDDNAAEDFCEEDIDKILQSRSHVVQLEQGEKNSTFSKATFSMSDNRNDIDVDDPNFWQKWAKKVGMEENPEEADTLIMDEPRQRRQTSRYSTAQTNNYNLSELEESSRSSDDDDPGEGSPGKKKKGIRKSKRAQKESVAGEPWDRTDLFKAEKCMLLWGWGRWRESVSRVAFKRNIRPDELERVSRAMVIYALGHYKGDDRIRGFICDLVRPDSDTASMRRHKGLSAPVARGRRGRRLRGRPGEEDPLPVEPERQPGPEPNTIDWDQDPVTVLSCDSFLRHLERAANKLLHRVQTLYFLHHEVIGSVRASAILSGKDHSEILPSLSTILRVLPLLSPTDLPVYWWDSVADSCLLMGIFKHGFEKYSAIRADPKFCFLSKCGPPSGSIALEHGVWEDMDLIEPEDDSILDSGPRSFHESECMTRKTECSLMERKNSKSPDTPTETPEPNTQKLETKSEIPETKMEKLETPTEDPESKTEKLETPTEDPESKTEKLESTTENSEMPNSPKVNQMEERETTEKPESPMKTTEMPVSPMETTEKPESPMETTEKPESPMETTEKPESPMETTEKPESPMETTEKPVSPMKTTEMPVSPMETTEKPESPMETTEKPVSPMKTTEMPVSPMETTEKPVSLMATTEKPISPLATQDITNTSEALTEQSEPQKEKSEDIDASRLKTMPNLANKMEAKPLTNGSVDSPNGSESQDICSNSKPVSKMNGECSPEVEDKDDSTPVNGDVEVVLNGVKSASSPEDLALKSAPEECEKKSVKLENVKGEGEVERLLTEREVSPVKMESKEEKENKEMDVDANTPAKSDDDVKDLVQFPSMTDLNGRFRKLIGYFQRLKHQEEFNNERYQKMTAAQVIPVTPEASRPDPNWIDVKQLRWSRREAADFYRVISSFGVEYDRDSGLYSWERFRSLANITRKTDQALTEYFRAFYSMCRTVCKREPFEDDLPPSQIQVDPISEERANRCLAKIDLLSRIRNDVLGHSKLEQHLELCQRSSDFPDWWVPGKHDKDLLLGAAKHGLTRTDYNVLTDEEFCFQDIVTLIQQRIRLDPQMARQMASGGVGAVAAAAVTALTTTTPASDQLAVSVDGATTAEGDEEEPKKEENAPVVTAETEGSALSGPASATRGASAKESPTVATTIPIPPEQAEWSLRFATSIAVGWPKDRTIQHRLEAVCQCVETGQWPTPRRFLVPGVTLPSGNISSQAESTVWSPHVPPGSPTSSATGSQVAPSSHQVRGSGRPRGRKRHQPVHDNIAAFRRLTGQSDDTESMASTDTDTRTTTTPITSTPLPTSSLAAEASPGVSGSGRKRKIDNLADRLMNAAAAENKREKLDPTLSSDAATSNNPASPASVDTGKHRTPPAATSSSTDAAVPSTEDPWLVRVPVINLRDGSLVYGDEAPLRRDLEKWLDERQDFMPYSVEKEDQEIYGRLAKSRGQDTSAMEALAYSHYLSMLQASNQSYASLMPNLMTSSSAYTSAASQAVSSTAASGTASSPYSSLAAAYAGTSTSSLFGKDKAPVTSSPKLSHTPKRKEVSSRGRGRKPGSTNRPRPSAETSLVSPSNGPSSTAASLDTAANMEAIMAAYQAYMYNPMVYSQLLAAQSGYSNYLQAAAQQQHLFNGVEDSIGAASITPNTPKSDKHSSSKASPSSLTSSRQQHARGAKTASALAVAASGSANPRKQPTPTSSSKSSSNDPVAVTRDILLKDYKALTSSSPPGALNLTASSTATVSASTPAPVSDDDNEDDMVLDLSKK